MNEVDNKERWQLRITNLKQGIAHIYETKEFFDVQFVVGMYRFEAHKQVLAAKSTEFAKLFLPINDLDEVIVDDDTVTKDGFEILLRFIYTEQLGTADKQKIIEAYLSAVFYKQETLKKKCEEVMESWVITEDEVCRLFERGMNVPFLRNKCTHFMKHNGLAVLKSPSFLQLSRNGIFSMLNCGALDRVPMLQRIDAVMQWFANKCLPDPVDYKDVRKKIDDIQNELEIPILGKLHIELLSLAELSEIMDKYDGLITPEESAKFMKFNRRKDASMLPEWCIPEARQ